MERKGVLFYLLVLCLILLLSFGFYKGAELVTSRVTAVLTVVVPEAANCSFSVGVGWNLRSLTCRPMSTHPGILADTRGIVSIHKYDPEDLDDPWKIYNPSLPPWARKDLNELDRREGYWIYSNRNTVIDINGTFVAPTVSALTAGWSLIGYAQIVSRNISEGLSSIADKYSIVYGYNNSDNDWKVYNPDNPWEDQDLQWLAPFGGYWIYMIEPGVLNID